MRVRTATITTACLVAALLGNHVWVSLQTARIAAAANVGVNLPGYLKFSVKLDHFAIDYGYVLIPFVWVVTLFVTSIVVALGDFFGPSKTERVPESQPGEP